jgi:hypothetical protein
VSSKHSVHGHLHALYVIQRGRCLICRAMFQLPDLTREHVVPVAKGGKRHHTNIVLTCAPCNAEKGDSLPSPKLVSIARIVGDAAAALGAAWMRLATYDAEHMGESSAILEWLDDQESDVVTRDAQVDVAPHA